jgi:acyl-CoA hydrolase
VSRAGICEFPAADEIDFTAVLRQGDTIVWSHGGSEPVTLIRAMMAQRHMLPQGIRILLCGLSFSDVLEPEFSDIFQFFGIGGLGSLRRLTKAGKIDVLPARFSDMPDFIRTRRIPVDVAMVSVTPPDASGRASLGATVALSPDALVAARVRIAQINPNLPYVTGPDALIELDRFDLVVSGDEPLPEAPPARMPSPNVDRVCELTASYIGDGSTVQLGIGSISESLPLFLRNHRHLGVHSAILTDGLADLIDLGAVDNERKEIDMGVTVAGELVGTRRLYDFVDHNNSVALRSSRYVLDGAVLRRLRRLVSVNSALEVDLSGQVNAETAGGSYVGAIGGHVDFVNAAAHAPEGMSVVALTSTRADGQSRIVFKLDSGTVTTARSEVDMVITEHGAAQLRARSLTQRAQALIGIAHPDHREVLARQLRDSYIGAIEA